MLGRVFLFAAAWGLFTGWDLTSWVVGAPVVCAAAWLSARLRLEDGGRVSPLGLLRLFPYFLWQSLRSGVDVAVRAIRGARSIDPLVCRVPARLPGASARVLVATVTTLLPGTLAVDVDGTDYVVHALSGPEDAVVRDVRRVETRVAPVFGVRLPGEGPS